MALIHLVLGAERQQALCDYLIIYRVLRVVLMRIPAAVGPYRYCAG